jgi:hypothetical protein
MRKYEKEGVKQDKHLIGDRPYQTRAEKRRKKNMPKRNARR